MLPTLFQRAGGLAALSLIAVSGFAGSAYASTYPCPYTNNYNYQNNCYQSGQLSAFAVDAPATLSAGQSGTWSVHVSGYNTYYGGGQLHYSVVWGDENRYLNDASAASVYYPAPTVQSAGTFTHVYVQSGMYTPVFTITDDYGHSTQVSATTVVYGGTSYCNGQYGSSGYCYGNGYPGTGTTGCGYYDRGCNPPAPTYPTNPYGYGTYPYGNTTCNGYYDRDCDYGSTYSTNPYGYYGNQYSYGGTTNCNAYYVRGCPPMGGATYSGYGYANNYYPSGYSNSTYDPYGFSMGPNGSY